MSTIFQQSRMNKRNREKLLLMFFRNPGVSIGGRRTIKTPTSLFHFVTPTGPFVPWTRTFPTNCYPLRTSDSLTAKYSGLYIIFINSSTNVIRTRVINFQCYVILTSTDEMFIVLLSSLQPQFQNKSLIYRPRGFLKQPVNFLSFPLVRHVYHLTFLECDLNFNLKFLVHSKFITTNKIIHKYD